MHKSSKKRQNDAQVNSPLQMPPPCVTQDEERLSKPWSFERYKNPEQYFFSKDLIISQMYPDLVRLEIISISTVYRYSIIHIDYAYKSQRGLSCVAAQDCLHSDVRSAVGSLPSSKRKSLVGESSDNFFFADFFADFFKAEKGFIDFFEDEEGRNGDLEVEDFNFLLGVPFNVFSSLCTFSSPGRFLADFDGVPKLVFVG